jgi:transcription termination factor Rho
VFVPANLIQRHDLQEGVFVEGRGKAGDRRSKNLKLEEVGRVNGMSVPDYVRLKPLHKQISIDPAERLYLARGPDDRTGRALDLIVPIGKGQRGLIISPPKSGKTTILKHMAGSIIENHPEVMAFVLLVDERPEEVTDFKRGVTGAQVLFSSSDQGIDDHIRMTALAMNTAVRWAEAGRDVVVFIDSLTRLTRAFNTDTPSHGRTLSGGLGAAAMEMPRKIFGAARNLEGGGSLTVMATILVDTGSRMDEVIFQEFKGTGNMDLRLSQKCADQRIWPAIDVNQSGTRKEHLLLDEDELNEAYGIRRALGGKDEVSAMNDLLEYLGVRG